MKTIPACVFPASVNVSLLLHSGATTSIPQKTEMIILEVKVNTVTKHNAKYNVPQSGRRSTIIDVETEAPSQK